MPFKIDKDIPPPFGAGHARNRKYPFNEMEVGDSFLINGANVNAIRTASFSWGKANKRKFSVRKTEAGFRCWRVS